MTTTTTTKSSKTKVFVGNLSFKTKEQDLADVFKTYGTVVEAKIITRGNRSLGYGFVEFATEEEAKKAIAGMNHKELDGRPLNVEEANPRPEDEANEGYNDARPRRRGFGSGYRRGGFRGRFRGYRGGYRGGYGGGGFGWYGRGGAWRGGRGGRPRRARGFSATNDRVPSKTTLFIANLPFSVDDAELAKIFEGFKCTAHVVKTRTGRSRGYGFVTFENEEDQQKALKALDGKEVAGANGNNRVISVKVALSDPRQPQEKVTSGGGVTNAPKSSSSSAVSGATTTTTTTTTTNTNVPQSSKKEESTKPPSSSTSANPKSSEAPKDEKKN